MFSDRNEITNAPYSLTNTKTISNLKEVSRYE